MLDSCISASHFNSRRRLFLRKDSTVIPEITLQKLNITTFVGVESKVMRQPLDVKDVDKANWSDVLPQPSRHLRD